MASKSVEFVLCPNSTEPCLREQEWGHPCDRDENWEYECEREKTHG